MNNKIAKYKKQTKDKGRCFLYFFAILLFIFSFIFHNPIIFSISVFNSKTEKI